MENINPADLIYMQDSDAIRVELAYARPDNLLFGERIYRPEAKLWLYKDLAAIVEKAARTVYAQGFRLIVYDGLRTTDAQEKMLRTRAVQDNPHWLEEPRLLSPPGAGGHPRAMAVDCALETLDDTLLDMGTPFDFLAENPSPETNPAHREHPGHAPQIMKNRAILDAAMMDAAETLGTPLLPLPQEWWDFRLPPEIYERFTPLSDSDLPLEIRMI